MTNDPLYSRDPTSGELHIMFNHIIESLKEVRDTMATKEFVNTKFDSYNDRVSRIERDQKEWIQTATATHVELDKDSKARHAETRTEMEALEVKLGAEIKSIKDQQTTDQKEIKQVRTARINLIIVAALSVVGNLIVLAVSTNGFGVGK